MFTIFIFGTLISLLVYLLYTRIYRVYRLIAFYTSHGVVFHQGIVPFLGSFAEFTKVFDQKGTGNMPYLDMMRDMYPGGKDMPPVTGVVYGKRVSLMINRPEQTEVVMLTQNKYFDKYYLSKMIFEKLIGDSIVFAHSNIQWQ
jgi:hypothetical protein